MPDEWNEWLEVGTRISIRPLIFALLSINDSDLSFCGTFFRLHLDFRYRFNEIIADFMILDFFVSLGAFFLN